MTDTEEHKTSEDLLKAIADAFNRMADSVGEVNQTFKEINDIVSSEDFLNTEDTKEK